MIIILLCEVLKLDGLKSFSSVLNAPYVHVFTFNIINPMSHLQLFLLAKDTNDNLST